MPGVLPGAYLKTFSILWTVMPFSLISIGWMFVECFVPRIFLMYIVLTSLEPMPRKFSSKTPSATYSSTAYLLNVRLLPDPMDCSSISEVIKVVKPARDRM